MLYTYVYYCKREAIVLMSIWFEAPLCVHVCDNVKIYSRAEKHIWNSATDAAVTALSAIQNHKEVKWTIERFLLDIVNVLNEIKLTLTYNENTLFDWRTKKKQQ